MNNEHDDLRLMREVEELTRGKQTPCGRCNTDIQKAMAIGFQRGFLDGMNRLTKSIADAEALRPTVITMISDAQRQAFQALAEALEILLSFDGISSREKARAALKAAEPWLTKEDK